MANSKLPVTIITGFLGSGKTTLVNHILGDRQGLRTAVLVNEFGAVGIDGALISAGVDDLVELSNGCVCCSINDDLLEAVFRILECPEPVDCMVVETTGLADPLPVAQTFLRPEFRDATRLDAIVTLVDAENFNPQQHGQAARSQLRHADIAVLNKCDLASEQRLREIEAGIRTINENARTYRATNARIPLPLILNVDLFVEGNELRQEHLEADGYSSLAFASDKPLSLDAFQRFLDALPRNVYRAKGILWFADLPERYVFHLTGSRFTLEQSSWTESPHNRLVLIGQGLEKQRLLNGLEGCVAWAATPPGRVPCS